MLRILRRMHNDYEVSFDRIYVLSPFRDVVAQCRHLAGRGLRAGDFADQHIGTVHTMQGREADAVVLVLGTDRSRAKKARDWAARPANLLNVAVSRRNARSSAERGSLIRVGSPYVYGAVGPATCSFTAASRPIPSTSRTSRSTSGTGRWSRLPGRARTSRLLRPIPPWT